MRELIPPHKRTVELTLEIFRQTLNIEFTLLLYHKYCMMKLHNVLQKNF